MVSDAPLSPSPQGEPPATQTDSADANEIQIHGPQQDDGPKTPTSLPSQHEPATPPNRGKLVLPISTPRFSANYDVNTASAYALDDYRRHAARAKRTTIGPIPLDDFLANSKLCPPKAPTPLDERVPALFAKQMKGKCNGSERDISAAFVSTFLDFHILHAQVDFS